MITVERQLPRNSRIIRLVSGAAMTPSNATPLIAARTNSDWSSIGVTSRLSGSDGLDLGELLLDAVDDVERRGRAVLQHRHQHRARAVDVHDVGLRRVAVAHVGDVADVDRRAVDDLDRQVAEVVDRRRRVVELDACIRTAPIFCVPTGVIRFCAASALATSCPERPRACERTRIEVDLHLARLAAERIRNRRARHGDQARADHVEAEVGELLLGQSLARQRELQDRHGRCVVVEDQRRRRARPASASARSARSR